MASRLLAAGHELTVYNRTRERAEPLVDAGATLASTPREACAGADAVVAMTADDVVVEGDVARRPTARSRPSSRRGALAIECIDAVARLGARARALASQSAAGATRRTRHGAAGGSSRRRAHVARRRRRRDLEAARPVARRARDARASLRPRRHRHGLQARGQLDRRRADRVGRRRARARGARGARLSPASSRPSRRAKPRARRSCATRAA